MKKYVNILFLAALAASAATAVEARSGIAPEAKIVIVQSVPEETVYGSTLAARPLETWLEIINGAEKTLAIEQFYIATVAGQPMEQVLNAVKAAAARGVRVRVMVDSVMMKESAAPLGDLASTAGVETRVINFKKLGGGVQHAKFFVADSSVVYVGSQNFDWRSLKHIHELGLKIESRRAAADFEAVFEADWAMAADGNKEEALRNFKKTPAGAVNKKHPEAARLNGAEISYYLAFSPKDFKPKKFSSEIDELLGLIKKSRQSLSAQVMTYSLKGDREKWLELDSALRSAAKRGVLVRLIFSNWAMGGKAQADIKELSKVRNITVKISSLPVHSSGFVPFARVEHCKYLVADDKYGFVSTSNWGRDYFYESRGAAAVLEGAAATEALNDIFNKAWNGPYVKAVDPLFDYIAVKKQ